MAESFFGTLIRCGTFVSFGPVDDDSQSLTNLVVILNDCYPDRHGSTYDQIMLNSIRRIRYF
jgi:hypothetical protein